MKIDNFIFSRVGDIENSLILKNEYATERDKFNELYNQLDKIISNEAKIILSEIIDVRNAQSAISNEVCYCMGFSDCIKIIAGAKLE